jgi:hypothetical protein
VEVKSVFCPLLEAHTLRVDRLEVHTALSMRVLLCVNALLLIDILSEMGILRISQRYCLAVAKDEFTDEYNDENKVGLLWKLLSLFWDNDVLLAEWLIKPSRLDKKEDSNSVRQNVELVDGLMLLLVFKKRDTGLPLSVIREPLVGDNNAV